MGTVVSIPQNFCKGGLLWISTFFILPISPSKGSTRVFEWRGVTPSGLEDSATSLIREEREHCLLRQEGCLLFSHSVVSHLLFSRMLARQVIPIAIASYSSSSLFRSSSE